MRKFLPFILGIATLLWIVGGTVWFKRHFCDSMALHQSATTVAIKYEASMNVHTTPFFFSLAETQPIFISELEMVNNMNSRFQPLNIYFSTKKYQFKESDELMAYFNNLNKFIILHPETSVKISAFASTIEGGAFAKKRLTFIKSFLEEKQFNVKKIQFENNQTNYPITAQKSIKNQRIEIRLVSL